MQDRYVGDIGDFVKYALLRAVAYGKSLGVAWYLHPNEGPRGDGKHTDYLNNPEKWRALDPELFDTLNEVVCANNRCVASVQTSGLLTKAAFADECLKVSSVPVREREQWRNEWFERVLEKVQECEIVFADPDNGLRADSKFFPTHKKSAKSIPLEEVRKLSCDRPLIVYHHNTRFKGGHYLEIKHWQEQLPGPVYALYWRKWSNRTFFLINADRETASRLESFAGCWADTKAELIRP